MSRTLQDFDMPQLRAEALACFAQAKEIAFIGVMKAELLSRAGEAPSLKETVLPIETGLDEAVRILKKSQS